MRIPTTIDVWRAIRAAHPELKVYISYSAPEGLHDDTVIARALALFGIGSWLFDF